MGVFGQCQIWCSFGFLHLTRRESPALHELFVGGLKKLTNRNEDNLFFAYGTLLSLRSKFRSEKQAWYQPKHPTSNFQTLPKVSQIKTLGTSFVVIFHHHQDHKTRANCVGLFILKNLSSWSVVLGILSHWLKLKQCNLAMLFNAYWPLRQFRFALFQKVWHLLTTCCPIKRLAFICSKKFWVKRWNRLCQGEGSAPCNPCQSNPNVRAGCMASM